jgi:uncharacterized protein
VVFAVTSGMTLDAPARAALGPWLDAGGGMVGIHSASATDSDWAPMTMRIGTVFRTHPAIMEGDVVVDAAHAITAGLPAKWRHNDEWYAFTERPETRPMTMLLSLDESSVAGTLPADQQLGYHALAWANQVGTSRTFYTALGHTPESYSSPEFLMMLGQGIEWAAKQR